MRTRSSRKSRRRRRTSSAGPTFVSGSPRKSVASSRSTRRSGHHAAASEPALGPDGVARSVPCQRQSHHTKRSEPPDQSVQRPVVLPGVQPFVGPAQTNNPHVSPTLAQAPAQFRYTTSTSLTFGPLVNTVDVANYAPGRRHYSHPWWRRHIDPSHRVWAFPSNNVADQLILQYGETSYASLAAAVDRVGAGSSFTPNPMVADAALIAYVVAQRTATNLSDPAQADVVHAGKFATPRGGPMPVINVEPTANEGRPGARYPCEPWPIDPVSWRGWPAEQAEWSQEHYDAQWLATIELWRAVAGAIGLCRTTWRRRAWTGEPSRVSGRHGRVPGGTSWGAWRNNKCGCRDGCSCTQLCTVTLQGPGRTHRDLVVDGEEVPDDEWVLLTNNRLARCGGCWPSCQNYCDESGCIVTYLRGVAPGLDAIRAVSRLACKRLEECPPGGSGCGSCPQGSPRSTVRA